LAGKEMEVLLQSGEGALAVLAGQHLEFKLGQSFNSGQASSFTVYKLGNKGDNVSQRGEAPATRPRRCGTCGDIGHDRRQCQLTNTEEIARARSQRLDRDCPQEDDWSITAEGVEPFTSSTDIARVRETTDVEGIAFCPPTGQSGMDLVLPGRRLANATIDVSHECLMQADRGVTIVDIVRELGYDCSDPTTTTVPFAWCTTESRVEAFRQAGPRRLLFADQNGQNVANCIQQYVVVLGPVATEI
jgi:hypothetical protein